MLLSNSGGSLRVHWQNPLPNKDITKMRMGREAYAHLTGL